MKQNEHKEDKDEETSDRENTEDPDEIASMCTATILEQIHKIPVDEEEPQPSTSMVSRSFEEDERETHSLKEMFSLSLVPSKPHPSTYETYKVLHSITETENCMPNVPSETPPPTYYRTPPTYSAVMRMGPRKDPKKLVDVDSSKIFARVPPPSYAEVEGIWSDLPQQNSSEEMIFGPDPVYIVCPNCSAIVITETYTQRSIATHFTAVVLCIFGCWPCCILPYFMDSCKNTYHHCPICNYFFGSYHPW